MKTISLNIKFWFKTIIYKFFPFQLGSLYKLKDPNYIHARDKHPVRYKHYGRSGWQNKKQEDFQYRDYNNYEEYKTHQIQKFDEIIKIYGGFSNKIIAKYRITFYNRFKHLHKYLPKSAIILCAGARQGTEVEVLHDIGFKNAYGIDLNPGPKNKFVRYGDFMHLDCPDSSLDLIYSNSIDHAYNLESLFTEHARAIKPKGFVLYDLASGEGGPFESVKWNSSTVIILLMLKYFKSIIKVETEIGWKWFLLRGKK